MKDTVIKETGNSRFLRSSVAEDITFAEFIALLRAGQLPIDLAGINEEGIDILGMPLGKSTLLDDETETVIWGSPGDRKPTEALKTIFETLSAGVSQKAKVVTGTYTGNGTGQTTVTQTINLGFTPKAVLVVCRDGNMKYNGTGNTFYYGGLAVTGSSVHYYRDIVAITENGFCVTYYRSSGLNYSIYANLSGTVYNYIAFA